MGIDKKYLPIILILVVLLAITVRSRIMDQNSTRPIVIGISGPLTGDRAVFGDQMKSGAEIAIDMINAKGGVLGRPLKFVLADDACDPKLGVVAANQLVSERVVAVLGHPCSGPAIAASSIYNEEKIPFIAAGASNHTLTFRGYPNVFRNFADDDQQGEVAAKYVATHFKDKKIAIIHDKSSYGEALANAMHAHLAALEIPETLYESIDPGQPDYSTLVARLQTDNIDVLFFGGYHTEAGLIMRQAKAQGMNLQLVSGAGLFTQEFWKVAGDAGQGAVYAFAKDPKTIPEAAGALAQFKARNVDPEAFTFFIYTAVQMIADAINSAGTTNPQTLMEVLHAKTFHTALGTLDFDARGNSNAIKFVMHEWRDGQSHQLSE